MVRVQVTSRERGAGASLVRRARRSVERARALVERGLAEHGVVTSRRRAERERIERAMPEALAPWPSPWARVFRSRRLCNMLADARRSRCARSSSMHRR